jgi:hypothetical protein
MDPDPTPDPTPDPDPFFNDFKDAKKLFYSFYWHRIPTCQRILPLSASRRFIQFTLQIKSSYKLKF